MKKIAVPGVLTPTKYMLYIRVSGSEKLTDNWSDFFQPNQSQRIVSVESNLKFNMRRLKNEKN